MEDEYIFLALIMHLVITIVIVVDLRLNILNEVEVLTTPLSKDIFRPTHYKTNLRQGANIHQLTALASTSRMRTGISPGQWQSWTAVSPLLGLISMT